MKLAEKINEFSRRSKISLFIDENVSHLKIPLQELGYKAYTLPNGLSDEKISELIEGDTIVTKNGKDFKRTAVKRDIDIIQLNGFIDSDKTGNNKTARAIQDVIVKTKYYSKRGNFLLTIRTSKDYDIEEL